MSFKVNQILHIQVASGDDEEAHKEYKTRVADLSEHYISIEIPISEQTGRFKKLYVGDELSVYYVAEGGIKNYFNSYVLGFKEDVVRLVVIKRPADEEISRVQRRNFLRVPAELEMAIKMESGLQFVARTEDVGGGGISFLCDGKLGIKAGEKAECWLLIQYKNGSVDHVPFKAELVRSKTLESGRQLIMIKFSEILDGERQKIIRYCFERQLDFRNR